MADVTSTAASAVQKAAGAATYGGAGSAVYFGYTANEWAAFGGLAVAVVGLLVSKAMDFYFRLQHLKIARSRAALLDDEAEG